MGGWIDVSRRMEESVPLAPIGATSGKTIKLGRLNLLTTEKSLQGSTGGAIRKNFLS